MKVVELLIEHNSLTLDRPFTYVYNGEKNIVNGVRVLIDFHHQELVGYVTSSKESELTKEQLEQETGYQLNEIIDVIDDAPLLNEDLLSLSEEISSYYLASKISVLQSMLPPSLSPRRSSLKAPKIAYDQYLKIKKYDETDLTGKQIEI
ncbi:MAG: primosomal protein N', partial [Bacilli bacterium]|nr:primosomal protein N' [Bacilli bacterium]